MSDIGDIMENARVEEEERLGGTLRLSRDERDYIAGHALNSIKQSATYLSHIDCDAPDFEGVASSNHARKIAALSNLLGDIGWERERSSDPVTGHDGPWHLGQLFPVAQLRPWLEEWQRQDGEALVEAEEACEGFDIDIENRGRRAIADAQAKLGAGAILRARIERWMASRGD